MKKLLIAILMSLSVAVTAQNARQNTLKFIYVYHNSDTPVSELCKTLNDAFADARNHQIPTVIYLSYLDRPYVATAGMGEADVEAFGNIISELQEERYHPVDPQSDLENLVEIFNNHDFMSENGRPRFTSMNWSFFVNQDYWNAGYNEQIIAKLYYILELASLPDGYLRFQVYYSGEEEFVYDKDAPFGVKDLCPELNTIELIKF